MARVSTVLVAAVFLGGCLASADAIAQESPPQPALHGQVHDRGVKVLQPDSTPETAAPAPAPVAAAPAAPASAAAPATPPPPPVSPPRAPAVQAVAQTPPLPAPVIRPCLRPISAPDMQVDPAADFQKALARRLRAGGRVAIDLTAPYPARNGPPAGLVPWFDAVKSSGGTVTVAQYCQASRGFGDWLNHLLGGDAGKPGAAYRAARGYDVLLHADALDQTVTQVEFVPRARRPQ